MFWAESGFIDPDPELTALRAGDVGVAAARPEGLQRTA